jgi:elongator complex protein 3
LQTSKRIEQLEAIGHPTDKIELIIMGGTFTSRDPCYQRWFLKRCFCAMNKKDSADLTHAIQTNISSDNRCTGLTIETRPDWLRLQHLDQILQYGATRVELGVQTTYDELLTEMKRRHTVTDSIYATRIAKDAGLKVSYHLMTGLPGSNKEMDLNCFKQVFKDERFRPDMIKIYPTLVIKNTGLFDLWKTGHYKPMEINETIALLSEIKRIVPKWVRIQRIQRDIPAPLIMAGIKKSNLRQLIKNEMKKHGWHCRCIRCREVGHRFYKEGILPQELELTQMYYRANHGKEIFLSIEDKNKELLVGYCRLRFPYRSHRREITSHSAIIRELKIHGAMVPIGEKPFGEWQHRGLGESLIKKAHEIAETSGAKKLLVTSGIGVKKYYHRLGFKKDGVYLSKKI